MDSKYSSIPGGMGREKTLAKRGKVTAMMVRCSVVMLCFVVVAWTARTFHIGGFTGTFSNARKGCGASSPGVWRWSEVCFEELDPSLFPRI